MITVKKQQKKNGSGIKAYTKLAVFSPPAPTSKPVLALYIRTNSRPAVVYSLSEHTY